MPQFRYIFSYLRIFLQFCTVPVDQGRRSCRPGASCIKRSREKSSFHLGFGDILLVSVLWLCSKCNKAVFLLEGQTHTRARVAGFAALNDTRHPTPRTLFKAIPGIFPPFGHIASNFKTLETQKLKCNEIRSIESEFVQYYTNVV